MMKKGLLFMLIVSVLLSCCGCIRKKKYEFLQDTANICSIQIVEIGKRDDNGEIKQTTICIIENIEAFLKDFSEVDCSSVFRDPAPLSGNETVIKILYTDGNYELIAYYAQSKFYDGYLHWYAGYYVFNEEQFDGLIIKYTNTDITPTS